LFSGLPWGDLPQALWQVGPALALAPWVGIEGVRLLCAALAVGPAWLLLRAARVRCSPFVLLVPFGAVSVAAALWLYPVPAVATANLTVGVVQGNMGQDQKWDPEYRRATLERYEGLSREIAGAPGGKPPALLLWPETSMPFYAQDPSPLQHRVARLARELGSSIAFGAPAYVREKDGVSYRNSVFLMGSQGELVGRYDKVHLVPFGEYVPFGNYLPFVKKLVQGAGDFTRGTDVAPIVGPGPLPRLGPLICFEVIFPELSRTHAQSGAQLLIVVTNDGWFGDTPGPYQHLAFAAWRAAENRLPLVRAANTGVSAAFDCQGRLLTATRLGETTAFKIELEVATARPPPAVHIGPWLGPGALLLAGLGLFAIFPGLRRQAPAPSTDRP
jgi:apolipoprotein N-acyltransferase